MSCSVLIATTIGRDRALALLRSQGGALATQAGELSLPNAPAPAESGPALQTAAYQTKKQAPRLREYRLPIGTTLAVRLRTPIGSGSSRIDDQVDATLAEAVTQDGMELIPAGSLVHGTVTEVVPASGENLRGQVTIAFAVVQHADTRSRAAIRTRRITVEAQPPVETPTRGRRSKPQPIDVELPAGHPLQLTLDEPLIVFIPAAQPPRRQPQSANP